MIGELTRLSSEHHFLYVSLSNGASFALSFLNKPLETKGTIVYANVAGIHANGGRQPETQVIFDAKDIVSIKTAVEG